MSLASLLIALVIFVVLKETFWRKHD